MIDHGRLARVQWRKSSRSGSGGTGGGDCIEVAGLDGWRLVRDSKDADGPELLLDRPTFGEMLAAIRSGAYDL